MNGAGDIGGGPHLFTICVDDLDEGTKCDMSKFVDSITVCSSVVCEEDSEGL